MSPYHADTVIRRANVITIDPNPAPRLRSRHARRPLPGVDCADKRCML